MDNESAGPSRRSFSACGGGYEPSYKILRTVPSVHRVLGKSAFGSHGIDHQCECLHAVRAELWTAVVGGDRTCACGLVHFYLHGHGREKSSTYSPELAAFKSTAQDRQDSFETGKPPHARLWFSIPHLWKHSDEVHYAVDPPWYRVARGHYVHRDAHSIDSHHIRFHPGTCYGKGGSPCLIQGLQRLSFLVALPSS